MSNKGKRWLWLAVALFCASSVAAGSALAQAHNAWDAHHDARGTAVVLLAQDWTDTGLIAANDDWSGVPGIVGYRGDGMAGGTAVDPQTVLADGSGTPVNVIANQTNPNTVATGGVAEFHLPDPVVAFQGSGTARAPHLVLTLDATGLSDIQVSYLLRDVDGGSDNAVQPVALQYRVGGAGNYTNLPEGFVADASTGPNQATLVTPVEVTLPADANGQSLLEVRIITTDAVGSDEWIGIDDILVTGTPAPAGPSILITEYMYDGAGGEFVELTNVGDEPVDMSGWRYDDDSASYAEGFDLSGLGTVQPGESVLFVEADPEAFRSNWNLCAGVRIVGPYTNNLGRNDQINIFDGDQQLVDRLTYGDQNFPGSIRTTGASGWVSVAGLGADDPYAWTLATVGDAEGSYAAGSGSIGSPGTSTHGGFDPCDGGGPVGGEIRITEWMYNTADDGAGEFVELTNVGDEPVDMTGWRYDDDSASYAAGFDLSGFGVVQPGESVVFTEVSPATFRADWGLCEGAKVIGPYGNNLGRADQVNIFDGNQELVDRLTYGDQVFPGSIRTNGRSGWVSAAGLGADDVFAWTLSSVGDGEGSHAALSGSIGSPGTSTHGGHDPCDGGGAGDAPTIQASPTILPGSIGDPTNPAALLTLADPDSDVAALAVTVVSSSNPAVLPLANISLTGAGAQRTASFQPTGRGVSNVVFRVTDPDDNQGSTTLVYAASNQAPDPSGRYHHLISDASAALDVGDGYMILLNDETNMIFLHRQDVSGPPVKTWTFTSQQLGTGSEVDFEGIARSGDLLVITGSHGNNRSGEVRPERRTFVAASITGAGADTELAFLGRYNNLWAELRAWDQGNGHGLGADALGFIAGTAPGVLPNPPGGFNIEALEFAPDGQALYLGFRAPTIDVGGVRHALIVPLLNVDDIVDGAPGTGPAQFGAPILLDLDGRSIRALAANEHGEYLISAGPSPQNPTWALYTWDGDPAHAPQFNRLLPDDDGLTGGPWESIVSVPHPLEEGAIVRLVTDSGDTNFYGTGQTKDLAQPFQKSYSQDFALAAMPDPVVAGIRVTEWMYDGAGGEFIELTNVGDEPVDMTGWTYDDDSADPAQGFDLSGFGVVQPGETVLLVEASAASFRSDWALCLGMKIVGGYTNNLGRNDQINLFDAEGVLADVLTYGDQNFPGSIRTQGASGWVSAAGLGADDVYEWTLSTVGDGEGSVASSGGTIGSPGHSTHGGYDSCGAVIEHTLSVALEGTGQGTVAGEGIACPGDCEETYLDGTEVSLTAAAGPGFVFAGWSGDCTGTDACALVMDGDRSVSAAFIAAASIDVDPDSLAVTLAAGESETLPLTVANLGDETLDWQVTEAGACALPAWADVDPADGSVPGGGDQTIDVVFDAAGLAPDEYTADLCIASNDPAQATVTVPLSLTVVPVSAPALAFDPAALDFGEVETGATSPVLTATLHNSGNANASGLSFGTLGDGFAANTANCGNTLAAGASCQVAITFAPAGTGPAAATLAVESVEGAIAALALQGEGVAPPDPETDVAVRIEARRGYVRPGQLLDYLVSINNLGPDAAASATVASTLSSSLDADFASWQCIGPISSGCTAAGQGDLADAGLAIPAGGSVSYLISAPVRWEADGTVTSQAQAGDGHDTDPGNNTAEAVSEIVLYRDGFQPYGDGSSAMPLLPVAERLVTGGALALGWPARGENLVEILLAAAAADAGPAAEAFRVERLNAGTQGWARLVVRDEAGGEYASAWLAVSAGNTLSLRLVDAQGLDGEAARDVHLTTAGGAVHLPLPRSGEAYRLWAAEAVVPALVADDTD